MARRRYKLSLIRRGRRRYTMLYSVWKNMRSRSQGCSTKRPDTYLGIEIGWATFAEFREWALEHGFSKDTPSPDRQRASEGYVPGNVKFTTVHYNRMKALGQLGDDWRGEEPPHSSECDCDACIPGFAAYG